MSFQNKGGRAVFASRPLTNSRTSTALAQSIHDHWRFYLIEGIVLSVLGLAAMIIPTIAGLAVTVMLGWLFLVAGFVALVVTFAGRNLPGSRWSLPTALVAMLAGALLLWNPLHSLAMLTYVLVGFFIIDGFLTIMLAISHRRSLSGRWEWLMVNGVIDLFLAGVILSGVPGTLIWALGLIVGIDMVLGGASLIAMAIQARRVASR
jgi:uncharacterized membrane protein HdeD (DUF308 family)